MFKSRIAVLNVYKKLLEIFEDEDGRRELLGIPVCHLENVPSDTSARRVNSLYKEISKLKGHQVTIDFDGTEMEAERYGALKQEFITSTGTTLMWDFQVTVDEKGLKGKELILIDGLNTIMIRREENTLFTPFSVLDLSVSSPGIIYDDTRTDFMGVDSTLDNIHLNYYRTLFDYNSKKSSNLRHICFTNSSIGLLEVYRFCKVLSSTRVGTLRTSLHYLKDSSFYLGGRTTRFELFASVPRVSEFYSDCVIGPAQSQILGRVLNGMIESYSLELTVQINLFHNPDDFIYLMKQDWEQACRESFGINGKMGVSWDSEITGGGGVFFENWDTSMVDVKHLMVKDCDFDRVYHVYFTNSDRNIFTDYIQREKQKFEN